jgi:radical SAM superfamily enzyme YgiQ (UPF0313 family)
MNAAPKVTVVVPTYNHGKFLGQRLESIFGQTYKNIELIVIDDCSTDGTDEMIRSYLQKYSFRHIRNERNSGTPFAAWETAASLAAGKYIWICEADDYAEPSFLEDAVSSMEKDPAAVLFYCASWVINEDGKTIDHSDTYFHDTWKQLRWDRDFINKGTAEMADFQLYGQTVPNMSSALISTEDFRKAYDPLLKKFKLTGDWLFVGWLMLYGDVIYHKKTLNYFRKHEVTSRVRVRSARSQAEYIMTKYLIFLKTGKALRELANVLESDFDRFSSESDSALDVLKALFHMSILRTLSIIATLAISVLLNNKLINMIFRNVKAILPFIGRKFPGNHVYMASKGNPQDRPDLIMIQAPGWGVLTPPLALAMLTAYARQKGFKVLPVDLNCEFYLNRGEKYRDTWELAQSLVFWNMPFMIDEMLKDNAKIIDKLIDLIIRSKPYAVGFTIYASSAYISLYIARKIKSINPKIKIIVGGPHASRFMAGKSLAAEDCVDVVAQGEGEWILGEFLRRLKSGKDIYSIPGTLTKKDGIVIDNGDAELIKDLDDLPYADFSDYNFNNYREPFKLPIMSSRGCVNRCIFCNERPFWRTYRNLTAKRIFSELQYQLEQHPNITWLEFQDSVVNGNIKELEKFADLVIENGIKIQWSGQAVIRKEMVPQLLRKLKKSGCVCLAYGLETASTSLMLKVGKVISKNVDINKFVKDHGDAGLLCPYNFMFGLPGETEDDANTTLDFLERNRQYVSTVNPSPSFCGFCSGTLGYENPQKYGLDFTKGELYWETDNGTNNYLVRLERFERFCRLVHKLGIPTTYPASGLLDRDRVIGEYYYAIKEYVKAASSFKKWLETNPLDLMIQKKYNDCLSAYKNNGNN